MRATSYGAALIRAARLPSTPGRCSFVLGGVGFALDAWLIAQALAGSSVL